MKLIRIILGEGRYRWINVFLGMLAVATTVGVCGGTVVLLRGHEARTQAVLTAARAQLDARLAGLKDEMRKAALKLSFNLLILPRGQDLKAWHGSGKIEGSMPEEYVHRLAASGLVTVRHFLPIVQRRIVWKEQGRRIILVGSKGEVANLHMNPRKPLVQPVPEGTIVLGYELHHSLGLKPGDKITLQGREFTVHRCHEQRGNQDDITAWIHLKEAQEMFGMEGRVNAILALECLCAGMLGMEKYRALIGKVLPDTTVLEFGTNVLTRAEERLKLGREAKAQLAREEASRRKMKEARERLAAILIPAILVAGAAALTILAMVNIRARQIEFALLRTLGVGSGKILLLILVRYGVPAIPGALLGWIFAVVVGRRVAAWLDPVVLTSPPPGISMTEGMEMLIVAVLLSLAATWLPALLAARRDPATVLRGE